MVEYNSDRLMPVILAEMHQVPDPNGPGVIMTYTNQQPTYAQIISTSPVAYLLGQQMDINTATHRAIMRWVDFGEVNEFAVILRERVRPDQSTYMQVFKVLRVLESDPANWWIELEIELQRQAN